MIELLIDSGFIKVATAYAMPPLEALQSFNTSQLIGRRIKQTGEKTFHLS